VQTATYKPSVQQDGLISVIICTCGRASALQNLLEALELQSYRKFEILIVDGNQEPSPAREAVENYLKRSNLSGKLALIKSEKGLTRQRNVGLEAARGDIICFFDDDVTFQGDFLRNVSAIFANPTMRDVGGITPYDTLHYPFAVTLRWRLRAWLGVMPSLNPGEVDRLGRAVPISFLKPWSGNKQIGWLPGFGMIYRRAAVDGLRFDELLPTYGGEDRDFSMRVGERSRLLICGDLHLQHHYSTEGRNDGLIRLRECSFGAGRRFAKYGRGFRDHLSVARTLLGDFVVDVIAFARSPRPMNFFAIFVRLHASFQGLRSAKKGERIAIAPQARTSFKQQDVSVLVRNVRDR
jgi:glycosyltransferase involved in cell wall biosynthesis